MKLILGRMTSCSQFIISPWISCHLVNICHHLQQIFVVVRGAIRHIDMNILNQIQRGVHHICIRDVVT